jgi:asparagine synthase (glutamine-hydrolysing)
MTALAGFWVLDGHCDAAGRCDAMLAAQAGLGRDGIARRQAGPVAMGRALTRLLPEDGFDSQPHSPTGNSSLMVADLRLDNRTELGASLGLATSQSSGLADSSLLGRALDRWGEAAVERLAGDFAFAWFDSTSGRLLLARDPLGQRPLFYARSPAFVAFASMPRGLHALPEVERRPDASTVARFLAHLPRTGPESFFTGVERVEPGHVVTLTPAAVSSRPYWRPPRETLRLERFEDYVEAFRAELDRAVAVRLRGAGKMTAAHLSGGWDSSAVAATAARLLGPGARLAAFTSIPRTGGDEAGRRFSDEGPLATATASLYPNVVHYLLPNPAESPLVRLERDLAFYERPLFNPCNHVWLAGLRRAARDAGASVLLSGEIGNWTISAGRTALLADYLREGRPLAAWRAAAALVRCRGARWRGALAAGLGPWIPEPLWRRLQPLSSDPGGQVRPALQPELLARMAAEQAALAPPRRLDRFEHTLAALSAMDFGEHRKAVLAGWGLDKRDPTADVRLVEFCLSLPTDMLLDARRRRPLARAALADRVPAAVLDRQGKGYQASDWHVALTRDLDRARDLVDRIAADPLAASILDTDMLRGLLRAWPTSGWQQPLTIALYRNLFLQALSAGAFLLFAQQPPPPPPPLPLERGA